MKQVFICEICGETFGTAKDACDCEKSHWSFDPDKLDEIEIQAYDQNYDSIMYLVVPCMRINFDGESEHRKMLFRLEGFVTE